MAVSARHGPPHSRDVLPDLAQLVRIPQGGGGDWGSG